MLVSLEGGACPFSEVKLRLGVGSFVVTEGPKGEVSRLEQMVQGSVAVAVGRDRAGDPPGKFSEGLAEPSKVLRQVLTLELGGVWSCHPSSFREWPTPTV